ncbi:hypothetical protein Q8G47_28425, partial [Klebsiella pneumoniae]|uniref:hypothetical protein n=1 Tax=Klebsiella pneumoniae TaxID=573 RepID=UPI0030140C78
STSFYNHHQSQQNHPTVKMEGGSSQHNNKFHYPSIIRRVNQQEREENEYSNEAAADEAIKAKIIAHPHYSNILQAYMDCQKVGAPAEVLAR